LLDYLVWKICRLANEESGRLFGMTYSAIDHILSSMQTKMQKETDLQTRYNRIYSLCKMRHITRGIRDHVKTLEPPLETVTIHVNMKPDKILKGSKTVQAIEIEESYRRFSAVDTEIVPECGHAVRKGMDAHIAGPAAPVGRYQDDSRVLVFLKSIEGSKQFRPLGSGSHDAYPGVFQTTSDGVKSDRYRFYEVLSTHAQSEAGFMDHFPS